MIQINNSYKMILYNRRVNWINTVNWAPLINPKKIDPNEMNKEKE